MKNIHFICLFLVLVCVLSCLTACGGSPDGSTPSAPQTTITTTTTTTPAPKEIPFTVKAMVKFSNTRDMTARLLFSSSQVEEAKLNELTWMGLETEKIDTSEYTDAFFDDKALLVFYCKEPSFSYVVEVNTLLVEKQKLTVFYTANCPGVAADFGGEWCILLEVNRADVADVTEIEGSRTEVTLPSGQKLE